MPAKATLAEYDDVIEAFATDRANEPFTVPILPYMDPARLQERLLFFEIPVAAIYSTSLKASILFSSPEP